MTFGMYRVSLKTIGPIEPRAGVIYIRLFKYTQHAAGFTENSTGSHTS